jgi:hypothetical protein
LGVSYKEKACAAQTEAEKLLTAATIMVAKILIMALSACVNPLSIAFFARYRALMLHSMAFALDWSSALKWRVWLAHALVYGLTGV